ncbi:MAG: flagellar biosynthetic protein FliP [Verrucomicrobiota bacterium]
MSAFRTFWWVLVVVLGILTCQVEAQAPAGAAGRPGTTQAAGTAPLVNLQMGGGTERQNVSSAIQILFVMTMLTLAPSLIMLGTSFTRIVIVLGFIRSAIGTQGAPTNQIIIGISLFLTFFIMEPVWTQVDRDALQPYLAEQIGSKEALDKAAAPLKTFMLRQTRGTEVDFFLGLAGMGPTPLQEVPLRVVLPAFVVSELRTAFQMGFLIFVPFMVIDFLVSSTLMSMGMMMMPPVVVSLPFKLLLFVLVDGWHLVIRSLVQSFGA